MTSAELWTALTVLFGVGFIVSYLLAFLFGPILDMEHDHETAGDIAVYFIKLGTALALLAASSLVVWLVVSLTNHVRFVIV